MKVILLETVSKLGSIGSVVSVKNGYANNFLIPRNKATIATEKNIKAFEYKKSEHEKRDRELEKIASSAKPILESKIVTLIRESSDDGVLYGSVTAKDIFNNIKEIMLTDSIELPIDLHSISILNKIKTIGLHSVSISLFGDVFATLKINVCRNELEGKKNLEIQTVSAQ